MGFFLGSIIFDDVLISMEIGITVREDEFTTQDGDKKTVDFMHSIEYGYIELPHAIGFTKPYADNQYSFVALLPDEGLELSNFIDLIDSKTLINAVKNQRNDEVYTSMPKFAFEYSKELSEVLKELGIKDAFDENFADFGSLVHSRDGNIYINRVIHKTKIEVDERGTKAGAVTAVEMTAGSAALKEPKTVNLNRPFFFMIVDSKFSMPIFMGALNNVT